MAIGGGIFHIHKRKRIHKYKQPYPHPDKFIRSVDKLVYMMAIFIPILTIPQAISIWSTKSAVGVSVITWSAFLFASILWLTYGIIHKARPIILAYSLLAIVNFVIVFGVLLYG